jgi:uncharacterized membrane protein YkoI
MRNRKLVIGGAVLAIVLGIGAGVAIAAGRDDDQPVTGATRDAAVAAALEHTGGGTVLEVEAGDDGAAYGVEVRRDDGSVVEVRLDQDLTVTGSRADDDASGTEDSDGGSED